MKAVDIFLHAYAATLAVTLLFCLFYILYLVFKEQK